MSWRRPIRGRAATSEAPLELRPVNFRYRRASRDGEKPLQFGLIAEEVADVFPDLVVFDEEGRAKTVKYHGLSSLLLNELQKQHRRVQVLTWLMGVVLLGGLAWSVGRWRDLRC